MFETILKVAARYKKKILTEKGNTVYTYSERQIAHRNRKKGERLEKLSKSIHKLRAQVKRDLKSSDPEIFLTSLAVALINATAERVGNSESADEGHFGVTGWSRDHISFGRNNATINYVGKSGVKQKKVVSDKGILRALKDAYEATEDKIFDHDAGKVDATKVNEYLKKFGVTAKDIRGYHSNAVMLEELKKARKGELPTDKKEREAKLKAEFKKALEATAKQVGGHTPQTLKNQYLLNHIIDSYLEKGEIVDSMKPKKASQELQAATQQLDLAWVEKIRKEFLGLMKNLTKIHDYNSAIELQEIFQKFRESFDFFFFKRFIDKSLEEAHVDNPDNRKYIQKMFRKIGWDFSIELRLPMERANEYYSPEARFQEFEDNRRLWEQRLRTKARILWTKLSEHIEHQKNWNPDRQEGYSVDIPSEDRLVLEGFQVTIVGFEDGNEWHQRDLERVRAGLKLYRQRASQVMPLLLKSQLPVTLRFNSELDDGGHYAVDHIMLAPAAASSHKNPNYIAHIMAHEMGHHLYKTFIRGDAKTFWDSAIRADYGPIDLEELLGKWPESMKWASDFVEAMSSTDPVLALQVDVLSRGHEGAKDYEYRTSYQEELDSGIKTLPAPQNPITGYAGKNPEESFCEVIGLLVAYGPRAVLPLVKRWLDLVLPGQVKMAKRVLIRFKGNL